MKSVTQTKSLRDIRTPISTHARSRPRQAGSAYLDVYILEKERQRLEAEAAALLKRHGQVEERMAEISQAMTKLLSNAPEPSPPHIAVAGKEGPKFADLSPQWKRMTIGY